MDRELGRSVIAKYLKNPRNIDILEKRIHLVSNTPTEYANRLYECAGYLINGWVEEYHHDIKNSLSGFDLSVYYDDIVSRIETDNFLAEDIVVEEGALTCPKCRSEKTFSYTKQVRSADEGTSVFARCYACTNKWRES